MTPLMLIVDLAKDLDKLSKTLTAIVEQTKSEPQQPQSEKPKEDSSSKASDKEARSIPENKPAALKLEDIRPVLAEISRANKGNNEKIKELLASFGADKLSSVDPEKFPALLEAAKKFQ